MTHKTTHNILKAPFPKRKTDIIITIGSGTAVPEVLANIMTTPEITSIILNILNPQIKITPFINNINPNIETKLADINPNRPNIQKLKPANISINPNILAIIVFITI